MVNLPFFNRGKLVFHLVHFKNQKIRGITKNRLYSNLPIELLKSTKKNYLSYLTSNNKFLIKNRAYLMKQMGKELLNSSRIRHYYYPEEILKDNMIREDDFVTIQDLWKGITMYPGEVFSITNDSLKFYVLRMQFVNERLFYQNDFWKRTSLITKEKFQEALTTELMHEAYYDFFQTGYLYMYYHLVNKITGKQFYLLCLGFVPELIIVKNYQT
jgi:hypothetical protein